LARERAPDSSTRPRAVAAAAVAGEGGEGDDEAEAAAAAAAAANFDFDDDAIIIEQSRGRIASLARWFPFAGLPEVDANAPPLRRAEPAA